LQTSATDASSSLKMFHSVATLKNLNRNGSTLSYKCYLLETTIMYRIQKRRPVYYMVWTVWGARTFAWTA